ncbi:MAG TPA: Calx-beta domain-containing protein, partial [Vicinamibacteria bacterium]
GADFTGTTGTFSFAAGELSKTVIVPILPDGLVEGPESFRFVLSNPTGGATLGVRRVATATIVDDETASTFQFAASRYVVREGGPLTVTVSRAGPADTAASVTYAAVGGGATVGADFPATTGTLAFPPNARTRSFLLRTTADAAIEGDETFSLALSGPTGGSVLGSQATVPVTLGDDDQAGTLRFASAAISRGESSSTATITVVRTGGLAEGVTVDYATANGTAQAGLDYTAASSQLTFAAGQASRTFTVAILPDSLDEPNETLLLTLSNPGGGATLGSPATATLTLLDDDAGPGHFRFALSAISRSEKLTKLMVAVQRTGGSTGAASVQYTATGGSATPTDDYVPTSGVLEFAAGQASRTFTLTLVNDALDEPNETVGLQLSGPTGGATIDGPGTATVSILDDDVAGRTQFAASAVAAAEGTTTTVTVTRTGGIAGGATVAYATGGGTATPGSDYTATNGIITFGPGETAKTFTVTVLPDAQVEGSETIGLILSAPGGGATLGSPIQATLYLVDDDG